MITCNCPPPALLPDLECVRCPERFGQIQKVAFQRIMNDDGTKNKFSAVSGFSEINSLANWQARITAADSTKIVISPYIYSPTQESGAARTFGGGNDSLGGVEEIIGREPSTFSASLRNVPQSIAKVLKYLQCENVGVYLIDGNGNVEALGIVDENNNEWIMPIPIKAFFVGDKTHGGIDAPDANVIQWSFVPNYSDNIKIFAVDTFNVLSDLCGGNEPPTPKRANIPDVATITYYATSDTTSCIFGYKSEYSTSGYTMLGYLDDENLIEIWQDGTNIMFLSDADIYAPSDCRYMFYAYHDLLQIDLSNFNTANVADMGYMFNGCTALTTLDLSHFDTANVTDMESMFDGCSALTTLNLSNFNTANVADMGSMFAGCSALTTLNLSNFNTANVTNMASMFRNCTALATLDLSNFDTENVTSMANMFRNCTSLQLLDLSNFDTANVTTMSYMFNDCTVLTTLNLSNFNTANVTTMEGMFRACTALQTLDLSNFDTANVTAMYMMFNSCSSLTTIYGGDWIKNVSLNSSQMFIACTSLVGGNGTSYNSSHTDATYARIDRAGTPGYFTQA